MGKQHSAPQRTPNYGHARIEATCAEHKARQQALAEHERKLNGPTEREPHRSDPRRDGPARGF